MYIYWVISVTVFFLSLVDYYLYNSLNSKMLRNYLLLFSSLILIFFGGIRGLGTGLDDSQYREFFYLFHEMKNVYGLSYTIGFFRYEPFTYAISYLTNIFTENADFFILFYCILAVSINSFFFIRLSPYPILALAVYSSHLFINKDMNQIRFGLSSSFFLGFVYYLIRGRFKGIISFFVLSFMSHATGIISILPLSLSKFKIARLPIVLIFLSIPLSYLGSAGFISYISAYLGSVGDRAMDYAGDSVVEQGVFAFGNLKNIILVMVFTHYLLNEKIKIGDYEKFKKYLILVMVFSLGGAFRIFFKDYASGGRLANYFLQVEPVLLSLLIFETRGFKRYAMIVCVLLVILYYLYYNTIQSPQSIYGYEVAPYFLNIF